MNNKREQTIQKHYENMLEQEQKYRAELHNENIIIARKNNELKKQLKQDARIIIDLQDKLDVTLLAYANLQKDLDYYKQKFCKSGLKKQIKPDCTKLYMGLSEIPNCSKCGFPKFKNHTCKISNKPVLMSDRPYFKKVKNKLTGRDELVRK